MLSMALFQRQDKDIKQYFKDLWNYITLTHIKEIKQNINSDDENNTENEDDGDGDEIRLDEPKKSQKHIKIIKY